MVADYDMFVHARGIRTFHDGFWFLFNHTPVV